MPLKQSFTPRRGARIGVVVGAWLGLSSTSLAAGDCWLEVYEKTNFEGAHVRIDGPAELASLRSLNGENWSGRIESLIVGPKAQILAFRNESFKEEKIAQPYHGEAIKAWGEKPEMHSEQEITFGAGKKEHHLGELNFHQNINSLKIKCLP